MSIASILTSLREAIDSKLPADQRGAKTIAGMTSSIKNIQTGGTADIEFYECSAYTPNAEAYLQHSMTLSNAADELANGSYIRTKFEDPIDTSDEEYHITAAWKNEND